MVDVKEYFKSMVLCFALMLVSLLAAGLLFLGAFVPGANRDLAVKFKERFFW